MLRHPVRWSALSALAAMTVLLVAACSPGATITPASVTVRETVVVQQTAVVNQTVEVPVEVVITATPEPFAPEGTLYIGLTTNVAALEVPYAPERQSDNAAKTMFDSLIYPEEDGTFSPALATEWEVSEDGTEYTFRLREGVKFHNGEDFNADSVVYSWEVYSQPEVTYANYWQVVTEVEKVDDYTVILRTEEPNALTLPYIALGWAMIPPKYHAEVGPAAFAERPVGTGPFMFEEWVKGSYFSAVANPDYWREGYPLLERVYFRFMPESATRVAALQAGEIDIAPRLTAEEAQSLLGEEGITVIRYPQNRVYYVAFNNITTGVGTPIEDPNVRKALAHAVDMDAIIEALFGGYATRATGFLAETDLGYVAADPVPYDPELAREMLAEAGYPDGFAMDMACPDGAYTNINEVCEAIRAYLDEVGVTGELDIMESNAYWELEANKQLPPLFVDSWSSTFTEAYGRLQGALGPGESYANWSDPEIDQLLADIAVTVDTEERAELYGQLQQKMRDDPPFIYLYYPETFEGVNLRVENYRPRPAENYYLWDVSVSDGQ